MFASCLHSAIELAVVICWQSLFCLIVQVLCIEDLTGYLQQSERNIHIVTVSIYDVIFIIDHNNI